MQETVQGGSFDGYGGSWTYGLDVRAGQRYMVELRARSDGPVGGLQLSSFNPTQHGMRLLDAFSNDIGSGITRLVFTAEQDGRQQISARGWGGYGETLEFELVAREIPADDHADLPAAATLLRVGQALAGELDWAGDVDCFRMNLSAGQPYRLVLHGDDPAALLSARLLLQGPDGRDAQAYFDAIYTSSPDYCELVFTPGEEGVYALQLDSPYLESIGSYSLSLDTRARDDHGDLPSQASGLALGYSEQGRLDGQADADCFSIVAQAGQRIAVSLRPVDAQSGMQLMVSLDQADDILGGYGSGSGSAPQIIFTAPADGAYIVRAEGTAGHGWAGDLYRIDAQVLGPDDAPDISGGVGLLVGRPVQGVLDALADSDRFSAWLQAGQRYRAILVGDGRSGASSFSDSMGLFASTADGLDGHSAMSSLSDEKSLVLQPASDARYDFSVMRWGDLDQPGVHYQLQLEPIAADDHADSAGLATSLAFGVETPGQLDTPDDVDYFEFSVKAGQQYWLQLRMPADGDASDPLHAAMPMLAVSSQDGAYVPSNVQSTWVDSAIPGGFDGAVKDWFLLPGADGTVIARVSAPPQFAELGYTLRLEPVEGQGPWVLPGQDQDGGTLLLGGPSELGHVIEGTPGNDSLHGTPLDDKLRGGDGNDELSGGGGRDMLLGGDGIDTAIIPVSLYAATLQSPLAASAWPVTDHDSWHLSAPGDNGASETGMLTLQGVERLQFTDTSVALDLDGHAGTVARLLTVMYGGAYDYSMAGLGLAWLDAGRSASSLAAAALADWTFPQMAGSDDLYGQWMWICRNTGGDPQHQGELLMHGVDALMHGQPLAGLVLEAAQSLGVTQQLELMGLPQTGLIYFPAPPPA